jgi:hypothetical protein
VGYPAGDLAVQGGPPGTVRWHWLSGRSLPTGQAGQSRRELTGGDGVEGAQAGGEFGVGQSAVAEEPA